MEARWAHNPEVPGSSPGPATNSYTKPPHLNCGGFVLTVVCGSVNMKGV